MAPLIDTLLLLGLPASGKSVIRRYLSTVSPGVAESDFHLGPTVQLDDFPYVHFMLRIDEVMEDLGHGRAFFESGVEHFRDWGTLVHLLNEDYAAVNALRVRAVKQPGRWIVNRLEAARTLARMPVPFTQLNEGARSEVVTIIESEAAAFAAEWSTRRRPPGSTLVIELARGGPEGSDLPLDPPYGYSHSLSLLSEEILRRAAVLYLRVTPEDSRRRNEKRARPGEDGSILHHGVPETVMRAQYGIDDMEWIIDHSEQHGTITVVAHDSTFHLPVACFDNRHELALFQRDDPTTWPPRQAEELHGALREAFAGLVTHPA